MWFILALGSSVFAADDAKAAIEEMRISAEKAYKY